MYIKSLIVDGFKSYCHRTEINGFDPQFNAITGLNGSGKSNILDAVCFLLGITNLTHVRASNLQELVYKSGQSGITKATVSAVFDNADKSQSPYGYEQFDELTITRQIVVGGKNKYLINGTNATNTRVHDLFHSVQLNVNNPHFLIMQGRITKILNMKPPEILSLLEEAASTKLYEHKKEVALKTIEKKDSKLREIDRVLRDDINPTIAKLREERSSYLEYQKIVRELTHLEKFVIAYEYTCLEEARSKSKDDLASLEASLTEKSSKLSELETNKAATEQEVVELTRQKAEYEGETLEQLDAQLTSLRKTEAVAKGSASRAADAKKQADKLVKSLTKQLADAERQLEAKQKEALAASGESFAQLQQAEVDAKRQLDEAHQRVEAVNRGLASAANGLASASLSEQARQAQMLQTEAQSEVDRLGLRSAHLGEQLKAAQEAVKKAIGESSSSAKRQEQEHDRLTKQLDQLRDEASKLQARDSHEGNVAQLTEQGLQLTKRSRDLYHRVESSESELPQLTFNYTDPEPNFDRARRVRGPIARLFTMKDARYATALEVAAGGKLYNVVVDTDATGKLLLDKGRLNRRVTLLPLNQIRSTPMPDSVLTKAKSLVGPDKVWLALSLITFDPNLSAAMRHVFGQTLVCPDLETARKVAFAPGVERRTVTLEGDVFDPQGTLSGGSRNTSGDNSILARLAKLHELINEASEAERQAIDHRQLVREAEGRASRLGELQDQATSVKHQLDLIESNLRQSDSHRLKSDVESARQELDQVNKTLGEAKKKLADAKERAKQATARVANAEAERERDKREAEQALTKAKKLVQQASSAVTDQTRVKETLRLEAEELTNEFNSLKTSLTDAEQGVVDAQNQLEEAKQTANEASEAVRSARTALDEQRALIDAACKKLANCQRRLDEIGSAINSTSNSLGKLKHQLELQTKQSDEASGKLDHLLERHTWIAEERSQFGLPNGSYCFTSRDPNEARRRITKLVERRDRLSQTVNMRAMNMLGSAEQQYADLVKRQDIVLADKRKIQAVIDDLDKRKKEVLISAYEKVNKEFNSIFCTLLPNSKARLLPPDNMTVLEGLEIKVAFGDVWKESLSELSGGQRSLAALSLILALLLFKPAPLYILDEVDAALDLSHTQNIGQLIKNHFQHSQFLVVSLKDGMFNNANVLFKTRFQDGVSTVTRHVPTISRQPATSNRTAARQANGRPQPTAC